MPPKYRDIRDTAWWSIPETACTICWSETWRYRTTRSTSVKWAPGRRPAANRSDRRRGWPCWVSSPPCPIHAVFESGRLRQTSSAKWKATKKLRFKYDVPDCARVNRGCIRVPLPPATGTTGRSTLQVKFKRIVQDRASRLSDARNVWNLRIRIPTL